MPIPMTNTKTIAVALAPLGLCGIQLHLIGKGAGLFMSILPPDLPALLILPSHVPNPYPQELPVRAGYTKRAGTEPLRV